MDNDKQQMLFSKIRLDSYKSIEEHFNNLMLIGRITPKLLVLEIRIGNIINEHLKHKNGIDWIENEKNTIISTKTHIKSTIKLIKLEIATKQKS